MAVAVGELRRRQEAIDILVADISHGSDEELPGSLRVGIERGWNLSLIDSLGGAKKKKESEIDRICYRHYGDFLTSVQEIVQMRGSALELKSTVTQLHEDFCTTGQELVGVLSELDALQSEREKTRTVLEVSEHCRDVSLLMLNARKQINAGDHYAAMHTIERIQSEQGRVAVKALSKVLSTWVPMAVDQVLSAALSDANDFLFEARSNASLYGVTLLRRQALLSTSTDAPSTFLVTALDDGGSGGKQSASSISLQYIRRYGHLFRLERWASANEFDDVVPINFTQTDSSQDTHSLSLNEFYEDLGPLHKALYTFSVLGKLDEFHTQYRSRRSGELQTRVEGAVKAASIHGLPRIFPDLAASVIGYFALECIFCRSMELEDEATSGAFSWLEICQLWDDVCFRIDKLCSSTINSVKSPEELLQVKEELLLMTEVISDDFFGLKPHKLFEIMRNLWERFEALQIESISEACLMALETSAYQPLYITSEEELNVHIRAFRLENIHFSDPMAGSEGAFDQSQQGKTSLAAANLDALEEDMDSAMRGASHDDAEDDEDLGDLCEGNGELAHSLGSSRAFVPKTFPFSGAVPLVMKELHRLVVRFFLFACKNSHLGACGESVCKAVFSAFDVIGSRLIQETMISGEETPLSKACQISIDAATFANSSDTLWSIIESALNHFRWGESIEAHLPDVISGSKLYLNRIAVQSQEFVFDLLSYKVDDLMTSFSMIDFLPSSFISTHHSVVDEIIDYLVITFMCLTHLPQSAREAAHFTCCVRLSEQLIQHLTSSRLTSINVFALFALDLDIKRLQRFAEECKVPHLRQCFNDSADLIQLLLSPELTTMDATSLRASRFSRVDINNVVVILEKMVPVSSNHVPSQLPKYDKSVLRNLVKRLKSLKF